MEEFAIKDYLSRLGCRKIKSRAQQVYCTCPFEHKHKNGKDSRPGFTVQINALGKSPYFCPSCKESDSLEWLIFDRLGDRGPLSGSTDKGGGVDAYLNARLWGKKNEEEKPSIWPEHLLDEMRGSVPRYALDRGLTIETCKAWELGHDKKRKRLIFPIRDDKGRLVGVSGRTTVDSRLKYVNYSWDMKNQRLSIRIDEDREEDFAHFKKSNFLYGAHLIAQAPRDTHILIIEGQIDVLMCWQHGWDVAGLFGSYPSKAQMFTLCKICPKDKALVALLDPDEAGDAGVEVLQEHIQEKVPLRIAACPPDKDPATMSAEEIEQAVTNAV